MPVEAKTFLHLLLLLPLLLVVPAAPTPGGSSFGGMFNVRLDDAAGSDYAFDFAEDVGNYDYHEYDRGIEAVEYYDSYYYDRHHHAGHHSGELVGKEEEREDHFGFDDSGGNLFCSGYFCTLLSRFQKNKK